MHFKRFFEPSLAQASYLIGDESTRHAIIVDPARDADVYIAAAAADGLRITHVTETHIHADFVSGARDLARRTGAQLLLSAEGGTDWQYGFAKDAGATLLHDGDTIDIGFVRLTAMHTPGHTPEHLTFIVTDRTRGDQPLGALTGDFVFVGDVGRPDLLEKAAGVVGTMEAGARTLFQSLQRFAAMPDYLQIWPGHGAGSACGKALGAVPQSTLGYERLFNWAFDVPDADEFARIVLDGQPEPPAYFAVMKRINRDGPAPWSPSAALRRLPAEALVHAITDGLVVDTRVPDRFAAGHVPGTVNVPFGKKLSTWTASMLPYGRPLTFVAEPGHEDRLATAVRDLALVGVDQIDGWIETRALDVWAARHGALQTFGHATVGELAAHLHRGDVAVLDVRNASEWNAGHLPGAAHVALGELSQQIDRVREIAAGRPIIVHCQGGTRSAIAASVLQAHGLPDVTNLTGGYAEWAAAGLPVERESAEAEV